MSHALLEASWRRDNGTDVMSTCGRLSGEILKRQELLVIDAALSDSMICRTFLDFKFLDETEVDPPISDEAAVHLPQECFRRL